MSDTEKTEPKHREIFLSYSQADSDVASQLARALKDAGHRVWVDSWELEPADPIARRIHDAIAATDIVLVLLSQNAVDSNRVREELSPTLLAELRNRAVTVVPALIENCDIPPVLADRQFFDLRQDRPAAIKRLVEQLGTVPTLDFSKLDARTFEEMVGDLLGKLGFSVKPTLRTRDSGFDFIASYPSRDPFGAERTDTWLVEAKLYRDSRPSIHVLQQLLGALMVSGGNKKGLIVTTGQLTSVARQFLAESVDKSRHELRVIDGTELTNLLIQHPEVTKKYFASGTRHG